MDDHAKPPLSSRLKRVSPHPQRAGSDGGHGPAAPTHLYLASQSPRRRELLAQIGVHADLLLPDADEDAEALERHIAGESALDYVQRVALAKAKAALMRWQRRGLPAAAILAADTTVTIDGRILGKPADAAAARDILSALSGRVHQVLTAVAVVPNANDLPAALRLVLAGTQHASGAEATPLINTAVSISEVRFAPLTIASIDRYIDSGEPFGKAGAYGIQGHAAAFIETISGSYSGIMGLPLFETAGLLRRAGVLP